MSRAQINRICAIVPVLLSLAALLLLLFAMVTGWERGERDEGAVAHLFQLLIVLQAPFIAGFIATADWKHALPAGRSLALQALALAAALAPVAILRL
jgi:hypothetical protein